MNDDTRYTHEPLTLKDDIALVERLKGTYDSDCGAFYNALDNILRFAKWAHLGTDGRLEGEPNPLLNPKHE